MANVLSTPDEETDSAENSVENDPWAAAAFETRNAAKWLIATLGALALGIFGAAPALRGIQFSWVDAHDRVQLFFAIIFGLLGLGSILLLIFVVAQVLVPVRVEPADLTKEARDRISDNKDYWLPENVDKLESLQTKISDSKSNLLTDQMALDRLQASKKALPENQHDKSLEESIALLASATENHKHNIDSYNAYLIRILRSEALRVVQDRFYHPWSRRNLTVKLVLLAAVGSMGFLFSLAKPDTPEPAPVAELGYITRGLSPEASENLWSALELDNCSTNGQVPVLATFPEDGNTSVRTIQATPECPNREFEIVPDAALVVISEPARIDIAYNVNP